MVEGEKEEPRTLRDFPRQEGVNDELRVIIKVRCSSSVPSSLLSFSPISSTSHSTHFSSSTDLSGTLATPATSQKLSPRPLRPSWAFRENFGESDSGSDH